MTRSVDSQRAWTAFTVVVKENPEFAERRQPTDQGARSGQWMSPSGREIAVVGPLPCGIGGGFSFNHFPRDDLEHTTIAALATLLTMLQRPSESSVQRVASTLRYMGSLSYLNAQKSRPNTCSSWNSQCLALEHNDSTLVVPAQGDSYE